MVPPELRKPRTAKLMRSAPPGLAWCAGCQSWRDPEDFAGKVTKCRPCASAAQHATMVAKVYGLSPAEYDALLDRQGRRCAICRAKPKSKRLAVDHDHKTNEVRGLLCSRCNHELMGAAWDSEAMALALWHYINTPPTSGSWRPPELGLVRPGERGPESPSKPSGLESGELVTHAVKSSERPQSEPTLAAYALPADWASKEPAELHALWRELGRLVLQRDPPPF